MAESVQSPCRNVCQLNHEQVCVGCGRTIGEISEWPAANDPRRRQICQEAARRMGADISMSNPRKPDARPAPTLEQFSHRIVLPVRWGDMDAMNHVNNVTFFTYGESGRIAYFDELAKVDPTFWNDHGMILASAGCDFLAQLRYPATLDIGTRVTKMGKSSLHLLTAIFTEGRLVALIKAVLVWFDYAAQKPMPIPEHVREMIRTREVVRPDESP